MPEAKDGCVKSARGPIIPQSLPQETRAAALPEVKEMFARVGQEAPDFETNAFVAGKGFIPIKLSDL
jgi:hypothetical protein